MRLEEVAEWVLDLMEDEFDYATMDLVTTWLIDDSPLGDPEDDEVWLIDLTTPPGEKTGTEAEELLIEL